MSLSIFSFCVYFIDIYPYDEPVSQSILVIHYFTFQPRKLTSEVIKQLNRVTPIDVINLANH